MSRIDTFLNGTTIYRLVLYYLSLLVVVALLFDVVGLLPYSPIDFLF